MRSFLSSKTFGVGIGIAAATTAMTYALAGERTPKAALCPTEFRPLKLVNVSTESHDTKRFRFAFPEAEMVSGGDVASCVVVKYINPQSGKPVVRPYTPVSAIDQEGYLELVVKRYDGSKMASHLFEMKPGDTIDVKGLLPKIQYVPNKWKHIGMIAGGTGITPMYQVLRRIAENPADQTKASVIFAVHSEEDILLTKELTALSKNNPNIYIYFTLSEPKKGWMGGVGRVNKDMVKSILPAPGTKDAISFVCGPPGMMEAVSGDKDFSTQPAKQGEVSGMLKEMGYTSAEVFKF
ncbi:NADH-cytochrome b5 reductase [Perkinsela sp. CCAP 1560/4]|nr:NADH-cytochrome b5 reductase [Perkinsela sp. CCAP 1560/4]KNH08554.1 NADH-cytochrome b5 reductase [Perkinsela sp. CCAP 1560/4]|eukprot:KNH04021.1 NADH-cytochrome b5 reductase [Perkinsela sp. CCAP 1560/4]